MEKYLSMLIIEQINRCNKLEELIVYPIDPPELYTLAERCKALLKEQRESLRMQYTILQNTKSSEYVRTIHMEYKSIRRDVDTIENYGIAILKMKCKDLAYLNKLVRGIHNQSCIPLQIASVASFSSQFYFFAHITNVIFMPAADHTSILNLPILYHELGHYISRNKSDSRLSNTMQAYTNCANALTLHFEKELKRRLTGNDPEPIKARPVIMHSKWKMWLEEIFSDCVATIMSGPAYAWTWLHITAKMSKNPFYYDDNGQSTHPADEARYRACKFCLKECGFEKKVEELDSRWQAIINTHDIQPSNIYLQAYPDSLLNFIAKEIKIGLEKDGFNIATPYSIQMKNNHIIGSLNNGWDHFWQKPDDFFEFERGLIEEINKNL